MSTLAMPKGNLAIRLAVPEDGARLRVLRLEGLAGYPEAFAADCAMTAAEPAEVWAERIAQYVREDAGVICVASTEGNELVGMAGLARGHWPKTRHSGTIWGVYVQAEWRGLQVADALLEACMAWAQAHGVAIVKLGVSTSNVPAIRCYARCGFMVYGIEPQVISYDGVYYDELLMARPAG
jgi:ribosomal protein S18 acetylase RimI-like enzyme